MDEQQPAIPVVVPAFDEEAALPAFHRRLAAILEGPSARVEILHVDDGSDDRTRAHHARRSAVVVTDADLQDPSALSPQLLAARSETGADVVFAQRIARATGFLETRRRPPHHGRDYRPAGRLVRGAAHAD